MPVDNRTLALMDRYWRAANYLSVGQIYLLDNPLLAEPLKAEHIKPRLLGHWGTTPVSISSTSTSTASSASATLDMIYICGPGHGGPGHGRQHLSGRQLQRDLSGGRARTRPA